jgi:phosphoribosylformimino-5-aminoimidazole carboxamide ribotide isomerase
MLIIPAIDIFNGKCVRLFQGKFNESKVYSEDPVSVAKRWQSEGATMIHIVDLNGAKTGVTDNFEIIKKIVTGVHIPVEVGGGLRDKATINKFLAAGVSRVIVGTVAFENQKLFQEILKLYGEKIVVAFETRNGKIVTRGWQSEIDDDFVESVFRFEKYGVQRLLYTDVVKDGTLTEPNYSGIQALRKISAIPLLVGGGVSSITSIKNLQSIGVEGVIIGKALYEERITLQEAINVN